MRHLDETWYTCCLEHYKKVGFEDGGIGALTSSQIAVNRNIIKVIVRPKIKA